LGSGLNYGTRLCFGNTGEVETVARGAEIFVPLFTLSLFIILLLLISEFETKNMFPILEHGIKSSFVGAFNIQEWLSQFFLISFLLPVLSNVEKARKWGIFSLLTVMLTIVVMNLTILFIFGKDTSKYLYPVISAAQYISIAEFLQNIDVIIMVLWIAGIFIKASVFYYVTVLGTAQLLELSNYQPIVFPIGFLIILFSFWSLPNIMTFSILGKVAPFYTQFMHTLIPLLLFLITLSRKKNIS
jgi:spore germination protein KB